MLGEAGNTAGIETDPVLAHPPDPNYLLVQGHISHLVEAIKHPLRGEGCFLNPQGGQNHVDSVAGTLGLDRARFQSQLHPSTCEILGKSLSLSVGLASPGTWHSLCARCCSYLHFALCPR